MVLFAPTAVLFLTFICSYSFLAAASSFHKKIGHQVVAQRKKFHDLLITQLVAAKSNKLTPSGTTSNAFTSTSFQGPAVITAATAPSFTASHGSFAFGSTSSFQIYVNSTLPKTPPPSAACASALTATVQCNSTIPLMSVGPFLFNNDLQSVCSSTCAASLESYRATVVSSCAGYKITSSNVTYLPTYIIDSILGPYTIQCLQDPANAEFCSPLISSYNTTGGLLDLPRAELCTFCILETLSVTLSNTATYSVPVAGLLSSAIQICGSSFTNYNVTAPPVVPVTPDPGSQFGENSTDTVSDDCLIVGRNITTDSATNCSSIATQYSISDHDVLASNPILDATCSINANTKLCIPQACQTYTIAVNDTCDSVAAMAGSKTGTNITITQLQSFNPEVGTYCQLMDFQVGKKICLTPNGGFPSVSATSIGNPSATPTKRAPVPTPTVSGTTPNCGRYYQVQTGDICNTVVLNNTISLPDFLALNPEVDSNCTNLWLGYYYCVAPFPPLSSASAIPPVTSNFSTATLNSFPLSTASYTPTLTTIDLTTAGIPAPTNVADGTRTVACGYYYDVGVGDTLESIADTVGVDSTELITWNPELQNAPPTNGSAICVLFPMNNYTLPAAPTPINIAPNTTTDCAQFYTVKSGDGCPLIESQFGISNALFMKLNPGLTTQCTNLVLGDAYCVFPTTPPQTDNSSTIPSNLAPGTITSGCTQYYTVVAGDSCGGLDAKFNLTIIQFIAMNPEINPSCSNLALGEAYCVQTSNSASGGGSDSPPSNVAPGTITAGCTQYYTVVSGDTCSLIESKFSLALAQFIAMNPEINSNCGNLILGDAYCVQSGNSTTGPPSNLAAGSLANCTTYHTVISGDNCPGIETAFTIAASDFFRWNPEVDIPCTNILVGLAYCVRGGGSACHKLYTVQSGDFCSKITDSQGITQAQLNALNPRVLDSNCDLTPGEILCVG